MWQFNSERVLDICGVEYTVGRPPRRGSDNQPSVIASSAGTRQPRLLTFANISRVSPNQVVCPVPLK